MHRWLCAVALVSALAVEAHADTPVEARDDHRGFIGSAALSGGRDSHPYAETAIGAEAALGWGVTPSLAVLARGSVALLDKQTLSGLELAGRAWPLHGARWLSVQLHGGLAVFHSPLDCPSATAPCYGGTDYGAAVGASLRVAIVRGRHGSLDLALTREEARFGDRSGHGTTMLSLGFSVF